MRAAAIAKELLNLLGPNGEHWMKMDYHYGGKFCIAGGCYYLGVSDSILDRCLPQGWKTCEAFNDHNDWPTIKSWLLEIAND